MSAELLADLLSRVALAMPDEDEVGELLARASEMSAEEIHDFIENAFTRVPDNYVRAIKIATNDMEDKEIGTKIIYFLGDYYPEVMKRGANDEPTGQLIARTVMVAVEVVKGAN